MAFPPSPRTGPRPRARRAFRLFTVVAILAVAGAGWWRFGPAPVRASHQRRDSSWGLRSPHRVTPAEADAAVRRFARLGYPIFCGGGNERVVALTFDDGPGPYTRDTVRMLRAAGARATFFLVGRRLSEGMMPLGRLSEVAALGNHTWNHASVAGATPEVLASEIDETSRALEERTGSEVVLFRPPYGARDDASAAHVRSLGMLEVLWTFDSGDSAPDALARTEMRTIRREIAPGAIVLLHENRGPTYASLREILRLLADRRLQPVTVPELLAIDPPSIEQLRSGSCS